MSQNKLAFSWLCVGILYGLLCAIVILTVIVESRHVEQMECEMDLKMKHSVLTLVQPCRMVSK